MHRSPCFRLLLALGLSACGETGGPGDASADAAAATQDSGSTTSDAGPPDAGTDPDAGPSCTEGCEFVELALGSDHSCARRANGEVWCWGRDLEGQLGDGARRHDTCGTEAGFTVYCSSRPVQVVAQSEGVLEDAVTISAEGSDSTCALREGGEVWCWGLEAVPQVNGGLRESQFSAQRIEDFGEVSAISDGWDHRCMIQGAEQHVVCYGSNGSGQLGVGESGDPIPNPDATRPVLDPADPTAPLTGAIEVVAGGFSDMSCARTEMGVWCWGRDQEGQLGNGPEPPGTVEECTSSESVRFACNDTPLQVIGDGALPLTEVAQLTAGIAHVCALRSGDEAGSVDCWGDNRAGQLGHPEAIDRHVQATEVTGVAGVAQVDAGARFTCARMTDGTVQCWGFNHYGQLGDGIADHDPSDSMPACNVDPVVGDCSHTPVAVVGIDDATELSVGDSHACVIRESGQIWCWGYNNTNQLGNSSLERAASYEPVRVLGLP